MIHLTVERKADQTYLVGQAKAKLQELGNSPGSKGLRTKRDLESFEKNGYFSWSQEYRVRRFVFDRVTPRDEVTVSFTIPSSVAATILARPDYLAPKGRAKNRVLSEQEAKFGAGLCGFGRRALLGWLEQNPPGSEASV